MDLVAFHRLLTSEGQAALAAATALAPTEATFLSHHQRLSKQVPSDLVKAALETAILRRKAAGKFTQADRMYFTREALEQSSGELVSNHRARRFTQFKCVADLCCGIGGDLIGLAQANVIAADTDSLRLAMAAENMKAYERPGRVTFVESDVLTVPLNELDAAFCDPDRRADGRRHLRLREYAPPVDALRERFPPGFPLATKVAPGVPWEDLRTIDAEAEFISVGGELKECCLWFGSLRTVSRRATVLPSGTTLAADRPANAEPAGLPLAYLYDPDPAIIRSGLVADLGRLLDARPIDPEIAYLTSNTSVATPFARCFAILEAMPFHARQLGERLRSMNVGPVTIMKRGSAVDVDELRRTWKLTGDTVATVILTRVLGKPFALIASNEPMQRD
ncbi:MAG TPA: class I SAM-dependent methyltransferase [Gemmataceae bacterium]|jgi:SAM-dependent methyltransferase|nr:class I SAM-dependent methyltransferase [Gemmataceae bacterium]